MMQPSKPDICQESTIIYKSFESSYSSDSCKAGAVLTVGKTFIPGLTTEGMIVKCTCPNKINLDAGSGN